MTREEAQAILSAPMGPNDADAVTIRDYFVTMILKVWGEGESFSGKRPFGNSGWECEPCEALVQAGIVKDPDDAYPLISAALEFLAQVEGAA